MLGLRKKKKNVMEKNNNRKRTVSESEIDTREKKSKRCNTMSNHDENTNELINSNQEEITRHDEAIAAALNFSQFGAEEEVSDAVLAENVVSIEEIVDSDTATSSKEKETGEKPTFKKLKANIPVYLMRKGKSKSNPSKGKRPLNVCSVDGDLLEITEKNFSARNRIHELTEESYRLDNIERAKNTIRERVTALAELNAYTLTQVHKAFVQDSIPISLKLPMRLSVNSLSSLLIVEENSGFLQTIKKSVDLQDILRRSLLEEKKLPVCRCGYIYVHPSLTFSKMLNEPTAVVGQLGGFMVIEKRAEVMEKLDKLRYFLEILYEYFSN